ncbi:hypothetical protein FQJ94_13770 [Xanthomonas vasicola]|uniref:hypothetical protein n=1 Tax=Xanthomonas vasicola TaxID=56459 RepID=UPI0011AC7EDE|nr:hypothetical protein [Xanthomonas vasicola]TWQ53762.1 hypothetical protein FQJ94_13770 [Xanthomonas vasicola]
MSRTLHAGGVRTELCGYGPLPQRLILRQSYGCRPLTSHIRISAVAVAVAVAAHDARMDEAHHA